MCVQIPNYNTENMLLCLVSDKYFGRNEILFLTKIIIFNIRYLDMYKNKINVPN